MPISGSLVPNLLILKSQNIVEEGWGQNPESLKGERPDGLGDETSFQRYK